MLPFRNNRMKILFISIVTTAVSTSVQLSAAFDDNNEKQRRIVILNSLTIMKPVACAKCVNVRFADVDGLDENNSSNYIWFYYLIMLQPLFSSELDYLLLPTQSRQHAWSRVCTRCRFVRINRRKCSDCLRWHCYRVTNVMRDRQLLWLTCF